LICRTSARSILLLSSSSTVVRSIAYADSAPVAPSNLTILSSYYS
jgi:hypothetical protein